MQHVREQDDEEDDVEQNEENEQGGFRPNWLAILAVVIGLIIVGWLLGLLSRAPDGQTLLCPAEDWVQVVGASDHVVVYCEEPTPFNG